MGQPQKLFYKVLSSTTVITFMGFFSNMVEGSPNCLRWLQKCIQTGLLVENLNPLSENHSCTLFTHSCISLSACGRGFARIHGAKSSTINEASGPFKTDLTILLIFRLKQTGDRMLPWGTSISCSYLSDRVEPALTWNSRWDRNPSMKVSRWSRESRS